MIVRDAAFLIRWHMLPAALPRIPISTVGDIVLDKRFTDLLELYRCDEFSSFKGPDGYYAACAAYKAFMKNSRNPYRDTNGRKTVQIFPIPPGDCRPRPISARENRKIPVVINENLHDFLVQRHGLQGLESVIRPEWVPVWPVPDQGLENIDYGYDAESSGVSASRSPSG